MLILDHSNIHLVTLETSMIKSNLHVPTPLIMIQVSKAIFCFQYKAADGRSEISDKKCIQ